MIERIDGKALVQGQDPMARKNLQGIEKNMGAAGGDEAGHRPQTQALGYMATRSQHKALVHLWKLALNTNKMKPPRLRSHELKKKKT